MDEDFIPPLLKVLASRWLHEQTEQLTNQLGTRLKRLMAMRRESNARMADFAVADVSLFWLLNALNSAEPVLNHFLRHPQVHPERLYEALASLAGSLLTFSLDHTTADIPPLSPSGVDGSLSTAVQITRRTARSQPAIPGCGD